LDENFGNRTQIIFRQAGHDVKTVREEGLQGHSDKSLYRVCCVENRCLVTLDLDFSNVIRFPPSQTAGIVVIHIPRNPSLPLLEYLIRQFLNALNQMPVDKQLWIVETNRIRIHQTEDESK
jgi:predicted nuclease of predicted toxin-antitoxin system